MAEIDADLLNRMRQQPAERFHLIVTVTDDVDNPQEELEGRGLELRRKFQLSPKFAVSGPSLVCQALVDLPWMDKIEEDKEVRTAG